jgi:hypothetical protein
MFPDPSRMPEDRPLVVHPDGSFQNASRDDGATLLEGRPVRDIGGGRVGQVIESEGLCTRDQDLLFVDCTAGSAIIIHGLLEDYREPDEEWLHPPSRSTRALQPPHGPLALTASTTVEEVAGIAASQGWSVEADVASLAAERGPQNRFDPFLGCQIFYPGSTGARQ